MKFVSLLLLWTIGSIEEAVACQSIDLAEVDGTCYWYNGTEFNWYMAKSFCESWGGALAEVFTSSQISFVTAFPTDAGIRLWIGAVERPDFGTWVWDYSNKSARVSGLWSGDQIPDYNGRCSVVFTFAEVTECNATIAGVWCMELPPSTVTSDSTSSTISSITQSSSQDTTATAQTTVTQTSVSTSSMASSTISVEGSTTILTTQTLTSNSTPATTAMHLSSSNQPTTPTSTSISTATPAAIRIICEMATSSAQSFSAVLFVTFILLLLVSAYLTTVN